MERMKVDPSPSMLLALRSPPIARARSRLIASPRPVPDVPGRLPAIELHEWLEHLLQFVGGNADARVADLDLRCVVLWRRTRR